MQTTAPQADATAKDAQLCRVTGNSMVLVLHEPHSYGYHIPAP